MSKHQSIGSVCPSRTQQNEELELQYKTCYARILDSKRRFLVRCQCCSMLTQRNTAGLVVWHSRVAELQAPLPGGLPRLSRMGCGSASFTSLLWQCTHAKWLAALHASARPLNMPGAATRYYELSQVGKRKIGDHEVGGNMTAFGARSELWRGAGTCNVNKGLDTVYPCSDQQALPSAPSLSVDLGGRPGAGAAGRCTSQRGSQGMHLSSKHSCLFCIHRRSQRRTWSRLRKPSHLTARRPSHATLTSEECPPFLLLFLQISEEDLEQALQSSIKCAVLAAAGPQRSRMLATLYKASLGRPFMSAVLPLCLWLQLQVATFTKQAWGGL